MTDNAATLRTLLWAVGRDGAPSAPTHGLHRLTNGQATDHIRAGHILLVSRERIESILDELEGKEPRPVPDDLFNDYMPNGGEEYADPFDIPDLADIENDQRRGPGRPRRNGTAAVATEEYRRRAVEFLRAHPDGANRLAVATECGIPSASLRRVFIDPRFVTDKAGTVQLSEVTGTTQYGASRRFGELTLKQAIVAVYAELSVQQPQTVAQLVHHLKYDEALIVEALKSTKFVEVTPGQWRAKPPAPVKKPNNWG